MRKIENKETTGNKQKKVSTRSAQSKRVNTKTNTTTDNNKITAEKSQEEKINLYKISEIRQDQYIQIPKELFFNENYKNLSSDAKLLYGLLLDRMELSRINNWINEKGEIYLIFTREEIQEILNISKPTCAKAFKQLTEKRLIIEKRQGLNKPNLIFIGHIDYQYAYKSSSNTDNQRRSKNFTSRSKKFLLQEGKNFYPNKTDSIQTDSIQTKSLVKSSLSSKKEEKQKEDQTGQDKTDAAATLKAYEEIIKENIRYNDLCMSYPKDAKFIDELLSIILDVVMSKSEYITINKEQKPRALVKSAFMKLNYDEIEQVISQYKKVTTKITRKKQYLLAMLYNVRSELEAGTINDLEPQWK